jgi:hypothetical protein
MEKLCIIPGYWGLSMEKRLFDVVDEIDFKV